MQRKEHDSVSVRFIYGQWKNFPESSWIMKIEFSFWFFKNYIKMLKPGRGSSCLGNPSTQEAESRESP